MKKKNGFRNTGVSLSLTSSRHLLLHNVSTASLPIFQEKRSCSLKETLTTSSLSLHYLGHIVPSFAKIYTGLPPSHYLIYTAICFIWSLWSYHYLKHFLSFTFWKHCCSPCSFNRYPCYQSSKANRDKCPGWKMFLCKLLNHGSHPFRPGLGNLSH